MSCDEINQALALYEEVHGLLLEANRLPIGDVGRFSLSARYNEIRAELSQLFAKYQQVQA